jgi:short-subunit dehydrogenase
LDIAIVTGASSGLGGEYVRQLDKKEKYDEIWIIARRKDKLDELASQIGTKTRVLPYDLTDKQSLLKIAELLEADKPRIRLLINAAGFGKIGRYDDILLVDCENMIELNCRALVAMTQMSLKYMSRGDRIMEISSTSAFQPFQFLDVYAATKAFVFRYSRALRVELFGRGIKLTVVCPYWIKDTAFIPTAQKTADSAYIRHFPLASREKTVASVSLRDSKMGFAVSTPGIICTLHRIVAKFIPSELMMGLWALLRRI